MEVKPKARVTIIPVTPGSNTGSNSGSSSGPAPERTAGAPNTTTITPTSGSSITIGRSPAPASIGSGGGGGGFQPRAPRYPRRDLSKFNTDEHRINERIRVPEVRLIDQDGAQKGVTSTAVAMQMAKDAGLDLVEISPNAAPPVCKILDYGKFKYEKKKKDHEAKKKQVVVKVKEVQLRPNTDDHDLDYKFKNIRTFLEEGDKAKITMMFRGREVAYVDGGYKTMRRLVEDLGDLAVVESPAKLEGKKLIMVVGPNPKYKAPKPPKMAKMAKPDEPKPATDVKDVDAASEKKSAPEAGMDKE